jgi:hypothetical protein
VTPGGLGRLPAPDVRDGRYAVPRLLAAIETRPRRYRYWNDRLAVFDQGQTSACVGYSWTHWLAAGPVTQPTGLPNPQDVYRAAQRLDEWAGEAYDGSSVRGGARAVQALGGLGSYWWAANADEVADAVINVGPVVLGTEWLVSMFYPDTLGRLTVDTRSGSAGGHAYLVTGVNLIRGTCRIRNSWAMVWGRGGAATMRLADLDALVRGGGEACVGTELRLPENSR